MNTQQHAYREGSDIQLVPGQLVTSFRGERWEFAGVSRQAQGASTGRVAVQRLCPSAYHVGTGDAHECPHMWHRNGMERSEYFPSVFNLYLSTEAGVSVSLGVDA